MVGNPKVVQISQLSLPQLDHLKTQLEEEINFLSNSMSQLKHVQQKLQDSKIAVSSFRPEIEGKDILVPLTTSMYVPGKLSDACMFICDIGTGYYIEKNQVQAKEFFQRRVDFVTSNLDSLQSTLMEKYKLRESIVAVMQTRVQSQVNQRVGK